MGITSDPFQGVQWGMRASLMRGLDPNGIVASVSGVAKSVKEKKSLKSKASIKLSQDKTRQAQSQRQVPASP